MEMRCRGAAMVACIAISATAHAAPMKLDELEQKKLDPTAKARLGLRMYRDEMVDPTPPPKPPYTEVKTHDWVLAQITRKLAQVGADTKTLRQAHDGANPGEVKDSLMLFLALKGEKNVLPTLQPYVLDRSKPLRLRELGVQALGKLAIKTGDAKLGDTLAQVLREDAAGVYRPAAAASAGKKAVPKSKTVAKPAVVSAAPGTPSGELVVEYPIRKAAAQAIKAMDKAGILLPSYVMQAAEHVQFEMKLQPRKRPTPPAAPAEATPGVPTKDRD